MKSKIGVCLIGAGRIGKVHAEEYQKFRDRVNFYVCDMIESRARHFSKLFKAKEWFTDYSQVLENKEISALDICLPHNMHAGVAVAALKSGKHVLLEKPIATNLREADSIINAGKKHRKILMIAENYRFEPTIIKTKDIVSKKVIGDIHLLEAVSMHHYIPQFWRRDMNTSGGGVLIDRGIHMVDCLHNIGGEVVSVQAAFSHKVVKEIEGEDTVTAIMRFKNGAIGRLLVSWGTINPPNIPWLSVFGEHGSVHEVPGNRFGSSQPPRLELNPKILVYSKIDPEFNIPNGKIIELQTENPFENEIEEFLDCVLMNRKPEMTGKIAREDLEIAIAIYKSAEQEKTIRLILQDN